MTGRVAGRRPRIEVVFSGSHQPNLTIEFDIDTGFDGFLTLPPAAVAAMRLVFVRHLSASLANDVAVPADVYEATIIWHGQEIGVEVLAIGRRPLLGTSLLEGSEGYFQFTDGGIVEIAELLGGLSAT